jgi:hypothetical protein
MNRRYRLERAEPTQFNPGRYSAGHTGILRAMPRTTGGLGKISAETIYAVEQSSRPRPPCTSLTFRPDTAGRRVVQQTVASRSFGVPSKDSP